MTGDLQKDLLDRKCDTLVGDKLIHFNLIKTSDDRKLVQTIDGDGQVINVVDLPTMEQKYREYIEDKAGGKYTITDIRYLRFVVKDWIDDEGRLVELSIRRVAPKPDEEQTFKITFFDWFWYRDWDTLKEFLKGSKIWPVTNYEVIRKKYDELIERGPENPKKGIVDVYRQIRDNWELDEEEIENNVH